MSDNRRWRLSLMLHTSDGRTGVEWIGEPGGMHWDRDDDGETTSAVFKLFFGDELMDEEELTGAEWRTLAADHGPLEDILKWVSHPCSSIGLSAAIEAARLGCDPDGWTDAHEQLLEVTAELQALRETARKRQETRPRAELLAHRLKNASFSSGYEDASPANAWTRQEKAEAKSQQLLTELLSAIAELSE